MSKFQKIARVGVIKKNLVSNEIVYSDGYPFYCLPLVERTNQPIKFGQYVNHIIKTCHNIDRNIERITREANKSIDYVAKLSKPINAYPMTFLHRNGINYLSELYDTSSTFKKGER